MVELTLSGTIYVVSLSLCVKKVIIANNKIMRFGMFACNNIYVNWRNSSCVLISVLLEVCMKHNTFLEGKILPSLIKFSIPLMLSLLLQALYGAVDLLLVGHFGSTESVSAVASGSQTMQTLSTIIIGLTTGVTVLIGRAIGARDYERASRVIGAMVKLLLVISIVITLGCLLFSEFLARLMNVPEQAFGKMVQYIMICACGIVFITAYNAISSIFRGTGNSRAPLFFILIACIVNILADLLLVGVLQMDVVGAATATVLAQFVSVVFSVRYILKGGLPFKINKESLKSKAEILAILKIGTPIAMQDFLTSFSFLMITSIVNSLGVVASASLGIAEKLYIFLAIVPLSFMSALSAFVAQNVGAGKSQRATKSLYILTAISFCFGVIMFALTFFAGGTLAMIFERDVQVIATTAEFLRGSSFEYLIISISFCMLGYFNGMGKTTFVMIQGLITAFLVRVPLSYFLSRIPNSSMFTIGLAVPISAAVSLFFCIMYFIYTQRSNKRS